MGPFPLKISLRLIVQKKNTTEVFKNKNFNKKISWISTKIYGMFVENGSIVD